MPFAASKLALSAGVHAALPTANSPALAATLAGALSPVALCALAASYLLGAIPFALVLGKLRGVDIRQHGSGNIGATNLTRTLGRRWGIAAFLLDFAKGLGPALGGRFLESWTGLEPGWPGIWLGMGCGFAAVLGHVFPVYLRFRGGKGVATTFGVVTGLMPVGAAAAGVVWLATFSATRFVSLASILAAVAFPVSVLVWYRDSERGTFWALASLAGAAAVVILARHSTNIRRLIAGKENRF